MSIMETLKDRIRGKRLRIIFPEGHDERVQAAANHLCAEGLAEPIILFSDNKEFESTGRYSDQIELVSVTDPDQAERWIGAYLEQCDTISEKRLRRHFRNPLDAGAIILAAGGADAMVAGLSYETEEVILSSLEFVGLQDGIDQPSSIFLMRIPGFSGSEGELLIFADCGVVPAPNSEKLAQIALISAQTAQDLLNWQPRVAFLSFSTTGSAEHSIVDKVVTAVQKAKQAAPNLKIDGEFQLDAAISPSVAAKKIKRESPVAGQANILIFPDLNAGNITYKAVQRFARADAFGPFLQGFRKSVSDLSRGSTVEDVIGVSIMALARALGSWKTQAN